MFSSRLSKGNYQLSTQNETHLKRENQTYIQANKDQVCNLELGHTLEPKVSILIMKEIMECKIIFSVNNSKVAMYGVKEYILI